MTEDANVLKRCPFFPKNFLSGTSELARSVDKTNVERCKLCFISYAIVLKRHACPLLGLYCCFVKRVRHQNPWVYKYGRCKQKGLNRHLETTRSATWEYLPDNISSPIPSRYRMQEKCYGNVSTATTFPSRVLTRCERANKAAIWMWSRSPFERSCIVWCRWLSYI